MGSTLTTDSAKGGEPSLTIGSAAGALAHDAAGSAVPQAPVSRLVQPALLLSAGLLLALAFAIDRPPVEGIVSMLLSVGQMTVLATGVGLAVAGVSARNAAGALDLAQRLGAATRWDALRALGIASAQLALLWLVFLRFQLENDAFYRKVAVLTFAGFVVHYFLPARQRMLYFLALSLLAITTVMGIQNGAWLVAIGLVLLGICHLRVGYPVRVALLLGVGGVLALGRVDRIAMPWSAALWPILGSFFMFRLIMYVYEVRHAKERPTIVSALSYFFLLPNVVFPFFPVVDYGVFRKVYYDDEEFAIYQRGLHLMARGALQLIAYRFVYHYLALPMSEVHTVGDLAHYMLANFFLYIRVSGQFHLVTGMLHLFGFNLPLTHDRYFLASSITDFWRRINIYWKDFMLKVVFFPVYFRLRKWGEARAIVIGTTIVFVVTWLLHSYQWFWLLGRFPIAATDAIMWSVLGTAVIINALYERKHGRVRRLQPVKLSIRTQWPVALKTAGTFVFICVLWSLWTAPSVKDWIALVTLN